MDLKNYKFNLIFFHVNQINLSDHDDPFNYSKPNTGWFCDFNYQVKCIFGPNCQFSRSEQYQMIEQKQVHRNQQLTKERYKQLGIRTHDNETTVTHPTFNPC